MLKNFVSETCYSLSHHFDHMHASLVCGIDLHSIQRKELVRESTTDAQDTCTGCIACDNAICKRFL